MGIVNLAGVSYETGGEAYFVGHTPTLSISRSWPTSRNTWGISTSSNSA